MHYPGIERRKYPRFNTEIPIDIRLIDLKSEKSPQAQFKGVTTNISMEGIGLELHYPPSEILFLTPKMMEKDKHFDLGFNVNLGGIPVSGIGDIRWVQIRSPSILKMGVFLKKMGDAEREKWTNFVTNQAKHLSRFASRVPFWSRQTTVTSTLRLMRDLITSPFSPNWVLPVAFISSSVTVFWLVEASFFHALLSCGISKAVFLLTKSAIFLRNPQPRYDIPGWFLRKLSRKSPGGIERSHRVG